MHRDMGYYGYLFIYVDICHASTCFPAIPLSFALYHKLMFVECRWVLFSYLDHMTIIKKIWPWCEGSLGKYCHRGRYCHRWVLVLRPYCYYTLLLTQEKKTKRCCVPWTYVKQHPHRVNVFYIQVLMFFLITLFVDACVAFFVLMCRNAASPSIRVTFTMFTNLYTMYIAIFIGTTSISEFADVP